MHRQRPRKTLFSYVFSRESWLPLVALCSLLPSVWLAPRTAFAQTVDLEFYDDESEEPVSARFQWKMGEKRVSRPRGLLWSGEWWLADPQFTLLPRGGDFEFLVQRGPEFVDIRGGFTMEKNAKDVVEVEIPRSTDMHAENWYSADHYTSIPPDQAARWQRADAIDVLCVEAKGALGEKNASKLEAAESENKPAAPKSKKKRDALIESSDPNLVGYQIQIPSSISNSQNGCVLIHRLPVKAVGDAEHGDAPQEASKNLFEQLEEMPLQTDRLAELRDPWARDVPILLATKGIRAIQILSASHRPLSDEPLVLRPASEKAGVFATIQRTIGKERNQFSVFAPFTQEDRIRFKGPKGAGELTEQVYWRMLEAGLRLPPTASSGFGQADTYLGYNRTYFYNESPPDAQAWLNSVSLGRTTATNGPLLRTLINGLPPGSNQTSSSGSPIDLDIAVSLTVREPVDYLDVIFNGETLYSAKLEDHYKRGEFPPLQIEESGWLVVRVVTAHEKGHRFATTAPFYFEFDNRPRISKQAVEFMQQWLQQTEKAIEETPQRANYGPWIEKAKVFWSEQLQSANAP
jgi:hypothetical protein